MVEPPKPRLSMGTSGKSPGRSGQSRRVELPTNRTAFDGGGFARSAFSKARISSANGPSACDTRYG